MPRTHSHVHRRAHRQGVLYDPAIAELMDLVARAGTKLTRVAVLPTASDRRRGDHLHHMPTLYAVLRGTARIVGGERTFDLAQGEAVAIGIGARHAHHGGRGAAIIDVGLLGDDCDFALSAPGIELWGRVPAEPYRTWCRQLLQADEDARVAVARRLLTSLSRERVHDLRHPHPAIMRMANALFANSPTLTAGSILNAARLSQRQAQTLFRTFMGRTPHRALIEQRLALAMAWLDAGATVGEAATRAGFRRTQDLTRAYRAQHGTPPRYHRRGSGQPTNTIH